MRWWWGPLCTRPTCLGQTNKIISFSNFQELWWGREAPFFVVVIISVGSNAVAAYTGNNHACLWHKRFTDNDRDQQTYRSDRSISGNGQKRTQFFFPQCKKDQCGSKNTHTAVPEKLTINFFGLSWIYYSASSLKQQLADRHVAPLGHIILILI
jgi:hypothetical protein